MVKIISILNKYKDQLDYPGVYRFVGIDPKTSKSNKNLYVGISGENAYNYFVKSQGSKPQLLYGRLKRHLENDAGVLGSIIKDIDYLERIEYWAINLNDKNIASNIHNQNEFKSILKYMEYKLRSEDSTVYDQYGFSDYLNSCPSKLTPVLKNFANSILQTQKKEIDFTIEKLSPIERNFIDSYHYISSGTIERFIDFRQYKPVKKTFQSFFKSWLLLQMSELSEEKLHWHRFEESILNLKSNNADFEKFITDFFQQYSINLTQIKWDVWLEKKIKERILLFDEENLQVKIFEKNNRRYLKRNPKVDELLLSLINKSNNQNKSLGILSFIYWDIFGIIVPIHFAYSENNTNFNEANLARWGYTEARIFSDLSKAMFENTDKYKDWIDLLFSDKNNRILKQPVYFYAFNWPDEEKTLNISIDELKMILIKYMKPLLNRDFERKIKESSEKESVP